MSNKTDQNTADPNLPDPVPYAVPPSQYGNPKTYEVFGREYQVLTSSEDYHQRGMASWYGPKFHGKRTSSGKTYDMHQMTAAHKSLPIPTFVQVTRLDTGRSIIVEVNDRGPFVDDRIIDLSFAAAKKLDMVRNGTAPVEVKALPPYQYLARHKTQQKPNLPVQPSLVQNKPTQKNKSLAVYSTRNQTESTAKPAAKPNTGVYLQAGAFSLRSRAEQLQSVLSQSLARPVLLEAETDALYRVKIGPLYQQQDIAQVRLALADLGIYNPYLVARIESDL